MMDAATQDIPHAEDHDAIMALIRSSQAPFRADASLPLAIDPDGGGFVEKTVIAAAENSSPLQDDEAVAVDLSALREDNSELAQDESGFTLAPEPEEIDLEAIRQEAIEEGRSAAMAEIEAIRAEAFEEGRSAGKAEVEGEFSEAREAFATATALLIQMDGDVLAQLDQAMSQAVLRLASERAGLAIKDNPKAFADRIETAAARLARGIEAIEIQLNPEDLKVIQKAMDGHRTLENARLRPDEALAHGDLRIQAGNIGMADILADQL